MRGAAREESRGLTMETLHHDSAELARGPLRESPSERALNRVALVAMVALIALTLMTVVLLELP